jgi:hypothetical protein
LPNFLVSYFWKPAVYFEEKNLVDTLCQFPEIQTYTLKKLPCGVQSVDFIVNGPGVIANQTKESVTILFDEAGQTEIIARAISLCGEAADTLHITVLEPSTAVLDLGPDRAVCDKGVAVLDAGPVFQNTAGTTVLPNKPTRPPPCPANTGWMYGMIAETN